VQLVARDRALSDQQLADALVVVCRLRRDRRVELRLRDRAALDEQIADPVAPVHDRRVADATLVEVDVAEVVAMRDGEAARLFPHGQELQHVGEARLLETALDRHQRSSSTRRPTTSGHSHTIFSSSRKNTSAALPHGRGRLPARPHPRARAPGVPARA
jgi:hypothetical protein